MGPYGPAFGSWAVFQFFQQVLVAPEQIRFLDHYIGHGHGQELRDFADILAMI
jgi:hypothetical protein